MTRVEGSGFRADPALSVLTRELEKALRAEIGARAIYPRLARAARDRELAGVLDGLHEEECEQVARVSALLARLGGKGSPRSVRRGLVAWALALAARAGALPLCLRLCLESETTAEGWYHECALFLARADRLGDARTCEELALTKHRHAQILEAWVAR